MPNVLVLGAGITGLSAAYHLARLLPTHSSRILLLERSSRVGGWLQSTNILGAPLEAGPRTLRPTNLAIIELIHLLNLSPSLVIVPKTHPTARARYIHFPPLTLLPHSLPSLLASHITTPALRGLLPALFQEPLRKSNRPASIPINSSQQHDESAYSLVARRFGNRFAREYLTPLVHGIYAADARSLSVRAAFPVLWDAERRGQGSIVRGLVLNALSSRFRFPFPQEQGPELVGRSPPYEIGPVNDQLKRAALFTLNGGIETLARALFNHISECPNVHISTASNITRIVPKQHGFHIQGQSLPFAPTHIISAIPLPALHHIVNTPSSHLPYALPHLHPKSNPASSVLVINLLFPPSPHNQLLHPDGFGYLVPRPPVPDPEQGDEQGYLTQQEADSRARKEMDMFRQVDLSHAILGTIFDSAIHFPGEQPQAQQATGPSGRNTRMTIMLGGPHPLPQLVTSLFDKSAPSTTLSLAGDQASLNLFLPPLLRTLARTLSSSSPSHNNLLDLPPPLYVQAHYHRNCIPTYTPGHLTRMEELRAALGFLPTSSSLHTDSDAPDTQGNLWKGRMHVIGAGVGGVSLGDCVTQARDAAYAILRQSQQHQH